MTPLFDIKAFEFDCAAKLLNDHRIQFYGQTRQQVENTYEQNGDCGEQESLRLAYAIVREHENSLKAFDSEQEGTPATTQAAPKKQIQQPVKLAAALPTPPVQTSKQQLQNSTMFTPLPSIVSKGYDKQYNGINWPHYENILKLFALSYIYRGTLTAQQQKDKQDLIKAIEEVGNAKQEKKHLSSDEIIHKATGAYLQFGQDTICAFAHPDQKISQALQYDLEVYINTRHNRQNQEQLRKISKKSVKIVEFIKNRYSNNHQ